MKVHVITLGCPKNAVDSEGMTGILETQGHVLVGAADQADVVIVNTCSFIASARDETLNVLNELATQKHPGQKLIAAGCMAESHGDVVRSVHGVDAVLGTREWMKIGEVVGTAAPKPTTSPTLMIDLAPVDPTSVDLTVPGEYADWRTAAINRTKGGPSAYVKISDGCNLRCAFCTIPSFKGDMRSKRPEAIVREVNQLMAKGVKEVILVAQHLTDYGRDLGMKDGLSALLEELCSVVPVDRWIRLMYAYPHGITPRLIETMAAHPQICKYLDMPLQHAHTATLRRMRRPPDIERTKGIINDLRSAMPDIAIRSTFIVGFPGETREEFDALHAFLAEMTLDRVGVFQYSDEPGTHATTLEGKVPQKQIERRWHKIMQLQQEISHARNRVWRGRTIAMLVEGSGSDESGKPLVVGRSFRDAPEVDGQVFAWGKAAIGSIINVKVTTTTDYDLWGNIV
ncbi:MAG: 30S ribosomal protein S12 methylthiotransferase RimO [Roseiflexaceae bacterium]|jgi:ribosomal protein S12 methylthiotransferase